MKVIAVNGSPRQNGNTKRALMCVAEVLEENGIEVEYLDVGTSVAPCSGCFACAKRHDGTCALPDDGLNAMFARLREADGILLGTPVHFAAVSSGMKCFLDRIFTLDMNNGNPLRFKVAAPVAAVRRAGALPALDTMIHYINYAQMLLPGSTYWPMAYGFKPGEAEQDTEGRQTLRNLGRNMAWLLKVLESTRGELPPPKPERGALMNFIR